MLSRWPRDVSPLAVAVVVLPGGDPFAGHAVAWTFQEDLTILMSF